MPPDLKRTGFTDIHEQLGARMVPFAGFVMPIQYTSIAAEHRAVRERAGIFDVSHMGEFIFGGPNALQAVQRVTVNDASTLSVDQAQYSAMVNENGGIIDDCVVYRLDQSRYMMVVNASNVAKDWAHVSRHLPVDVTLADESESTSLLAVQGPQASQVMAVVTDVPLDELRFYWKREGVVASVPTIVSRTGYTGELGYELYFDRGGSAAVWEAVMEAGEVVPCGLAARDTLRLEMRYALYGSDIDETVNPYEAALGWIVKLDKGDFVGRERLREIADSGPKRRLVGFRLLERGIPRTGYPVAVDGTEISEVRSGAMSPSLGYGIGTCYVPCEHAKPGGTLAILIRGKEVAAEIVKPPFYGGGSLNR